MLAWAFGRLNPFIRLLKNKAFQDDAGRANRVVRHDYTTWRVIAHEEERGY
jgi:hypothetical protein